MRGKILRMCKTLAGRSTMEGRRDCAAVLSDWEGRERIRER